MACGKLVFVWVTILASMAFVLAEEGSGAASNDEASERASFSFPNFGLSGNMGGLSGGIPNFGQFLGGGGSGNGSSNPFSQFLSAFGQLIPGSGGSGGSSAMGNMEGSGSMGASRYRRDVNENGEDDHPEHDEHGRHGDHGGHERRGDHGDHAEHERRGDHGEHGDHPEHDEHERRGDHGRHGDHGEQGDQQNRLFFGHFFGVPVSCNYTTQAGSRCAGCASRLICLPGNRGFLRSCGFLHPYCNNGRCSKIPGSACFTTVAVVDTAAATTNTATTGGATT